MRTLRGACLAVACLVASCGAAPDPRPALAAAPPADLSRCAGPVPVPPAPKVPRTMEAIARWTYAIDAALVRSEAARAECARRLARLHEWIASGGQ